MIVLELEVGAFIVITQEKAAYTIN